MRPTPTMNALVAAIETEDKDAARPPYLELHRHRLRGWPAPAGWDDAKLAILLKVVGRWLGDGDE